MTATAVGSLLLAGFALGLGLAGCGQKGALFLPTPLPPAAAASAPTAPQ